MVGPPYTIFWFKSQRPPTRFSDSKTGYPLKGFSDSKTGYPLKGFSGSKLKIDQFDS